MRRAPKFFLVHMLAHVLTRASGRRGQPSLAVTDSMFAAAPAMVSTPPRQLSRLQAASFSALGEPVEPPDSRHGACCPGAARPHRRLGRPAPPTPSGHFVERLAVVPKYRRVSNVHVRTHTLLAAADPPDPVRLRNHLPDHTAAYTAPRRRDPRRDPVWTGHASSHQGCRWLIATQVAASSALGASQ
jgi:hypothetical protein